MKQKKVLITGSRDWDNIERVLEVLEGIKKRFGDDVVVIHGACRGADTIAGEVAKELFKPKPRSYPADWKKYGRPAGVIRNQQMIDEEHVVDEPIDLCVAFHDDIENSTGTKDCASRAKKAAIGVLFVTADSISSWRPARKDGMTDEKAVESTTTVEEPIERFVAHNAFLSNFYDSTVYVDRKRYATVEHAYQAAKTNDEESKRLIREAKTPAIAKKLGRAVKIRDDWDAIKIEVMTDLVRKKFESPFLAAMLLETGTRDIIEVNYWNDRFWGVCKGVGENWLGKILMQVREEIRASKDD